MNAPCLAVRIWQRLRSPVPQNRNALMFSEYRGRPVLLRPKVSVDRPWLVEEWIPDPDECREIDRDQAGPACAEPPSLPMADADSDAAPDVNPAGVSGL